MVSVEQSAARLRELIPITPAFQGTHVPGLTVQRAWRTRGLRRFDKDGFTVLPDTIRLNEVAVALGPQAGAVSDEASFPVDDPRSFLIASFLRAADLYDAAGRKLVIHGFRDPRGRTYPIRALDSRKMQETSQTALLFDATDPRIGMLADLLRCARAIERDQGSTPAAFDDGVAREQESLSGQLAELFARLTGDVDLLDPSGQVVSPTAIRFLNERERLPIPRLMGRLDLQAAILGTLQAIGVPAYDGAGRIEAITLRSLESLRTYVGSLQKNLTPWTFGCDARCLFCYTDFGLGSVQYPGRWDRTPHEIDLYVEHYDPATKTGLPMPVFSMQDWEPTRHPNFLGIIDAIATKAPDEPIFIVTHGGLLDRETVQSLSRYPQVTMQISLNSSDVANRELIMRPQNAREGIDALRLCREFNVAFDVSIVATPQWVGVDDLIETIRFADASGADFIRLALPTATSDHHPDLLLTDEQLAAIDELAKAMRPEVETPILVTVALLNESRLEAKVEGVLKRSVAQAYGIRAGDVITHVGGVRPRSRTECSELLDGARSSQAIELEVRRGSEEQTVRIALGDDSSAGARVTGVLGRGAKELGPLGILMPDDVDFAIFRQIRAICDLHDFRRPMVLTSQVMQPFFEQALEVLRPDERVRGLILRTASNEHFGGNVVIAGLQTVSDYISAIEAYIADGNDAPDAVFLSAMAFAAGGVDLTGRTSKAIDNHFGIPTFLLRPRTGSY